MLATVKARLERVVVPPLGKSLVALGALRGAEIVMAGERRVLRVDLFFEGILKAQEARLLIVIYKALEHIDGADEVEVVVNGEATPRPARRAPVPIPGVRHVVAVASGKGGVGKSTVAVNLAVTLARRGESVGLLDADIYGPNVPTMLGLPPGVKAEMVRGRLGPLVAHGVKALSVGVLGVAPEAALVWRGPLLTKLIHQLLFQADWAPLDTLVIDLPPGTGDVALTLVQAAPLSGAILVATPQRVALEDALRAHTMLHEAGVPVLGLVENMAYHACAGCGREADLFGRGGARRAAEARGLPLLAELPLVEAIRERSDDGRPAALDPALAPAFDALAARVSDALAAGK